LPLEYRLLGTRPARWEPINTVYFFLQMAYTLAWVDPTLVKLDARSLVGARAAEALFPVNNPVQEPIQPFGNPRQAGPRYDYARPFPPPGLPDTAAMVALAQRNDLEH